MEPTPYRPSGTRTSARRTVLIVTAVILLVAIGLFLHAIGVLPPE